MAEKINIESNNKTMTDLSSDPREYEEIIDDLSTRLAESFYQTIQILSAAVSMLERYYDGSHSRFVADKSVEVAVALDLDPEQIYEIRVAGLLHDIGKIGFKDTLLAKYPAEMNQADHILYLKHPERGMQLLTKNPAFEKISEIIYQHHERMDGSGFPRHLVSDQIDIGASIIGVVDTFHNALFKRTIERAGSLYSNIKYTSTSSYISSSKDKFVSIMNYLQQKSNILFDGDVVNVFTNIIQAERSCIGQKMVMRVHVRNLEEGMILAEDYFSLAGLLIAAAGERLTTETKKGLIRFAESGQINSKILIMR